MSYFFNRRFVWGWFPFTLKWGRWLGFWLLKYPICLKINDSLLFFFFLAAPQVIQDFSFPARDETHALCSGSMSANYLTTRVVSPSIFSVFVFARTQEDNKNIQVHVTLGSSGDWDKLGSVCPYGFQFQKNFKTLWMKQNASPGRMPPSDQQL